MKDDDSSPERVVVPGRTRVRRWAFALGALLAIVLTGIIGWNYVRDEVRRWFDETHSSHGWSWRLWGARGNPSDFSIDSARVDGPSVRLRIRRLSVGISWKGTPHLIPGTISVMASRVDILPVRSASTDSSAPAFPELRLPFALRLDLDTLALRENSIEKGGFLGWMRGIHMATRGPDGVSLVARRIEAPSFAGQLAVDLDLDWSESDTVRAKTRIVGTSGCCASDTVTARAALCRRDLRWGQAHVHASIEESRGWSEALPALARIPAFHSIQADLWGSVDSAGRNIKASIGFSADSLSVLPPMDWDLDASLSGRDARVALYGALPASESNNLELDLSALLPRSLSPLGAQATGTLSVQGIAMPIAGFQHPFDSRTRILSLDRRGAAIELTTAAGSVIDGQARWKGMHWSLDGNIVPLEPWAVAWVDSLRMQGGGRAHGEDSAGNALFQVTAYRPGIRIVQLDSLSTRLRLWLPGPQLQFSNIHAFRSTRTWDGTGRISLPDSSVDFHLTPAWDSAGGADLHVKIGGAVDIRAGNFPSTGLPLSIPYLPQFPTRVDATFHREQPAPGTPAISQVAATIRGRPNQDSLRISLNLAISDSSLRLSGVNASIGASSLDAGIMVGRTQEGWLLDTLTGSSSGFDLADLRGVVPGMPELRGRLSGHFLSYRGQGVSADLKLASPAVVKPEGDFILPDLLLWGERDTLHLGGWWPVGGGRAPFRLTATRLWDPTPEFDLLAYWGDVLKLEANGRFEDKKRIRTDLLRLSGSSALPGTEARLRDILVDGRFDGDLGANGFVWKAKANGRQGHLQAVAGNPLELHFTALADKDSVRLQDADLGGAQNGTLHLKGGLAIDSRKFWLDGHGRDIRFDLGSGKRLEVDSIRLSALPDSRIIADLQGGAWHQGWNRDEFLDLRIPRASLALAQARDWRKLSGDVAVDRLLFTRNFADFPSLWTAARQMIGKRRSTGASAGTSTSTLLDVRLWSMGDSIRLRDNLGSARMSFDLQVAGPADAPLLNGFMAADTDGGHFGYLKRDFHIDTLRVDWNTQTIPEGKFQLAGFRNIRRSCQEATTTSTSMSSTVDSCRLSLSAQGTLDNPRLRSPTSDCALQPGDDGTVGATVALATGCYPQQNGNNRMGSAIQNAGTDWLVDQGKDWVNEFLARRLRNSRSDLVWLPDSVALTDIPTNNATRDQLGLMALYHITPEMDAAGIYQHTFAQSATAVGSKPVLSDNYGLSLQYRIPFHWIDDPEDRKRLENRVFLQCDLGEALDDNLRRSTVIQPSLRYRWEFW